jgi:4-amino-4-deoxy-L-arabinose transferase-like glycosyltransferase
MLFVLGGWFLVELLTIDFSEGIVHPYYASALAPGVAVMAGAGAVAICGLLARGRSGGGAAERDGRRGMALLVLAVVASVGVQILLIHREGYPEYWRIPLVVLALAGLAVVVLVRGRAALAVYALVLVLMVAPALYSSSVWDAPVEGTFPVAGPYNYAGPGGFGVGRVGLEINRSLWRYLRSHQPGKRFALLTVASDTASPLILFGLDAASLGGYNGSDPAMSADTLAKLVASDEARYVMIGGPFAIRGGNSASTAARLACPEVPSRLWNTDWKTLTPFYLVDCRGRAAELRNPGRTAGAYIAAEIRSGVDIDH